MRDKATVGGAIMDETLRYDDILECRGGGGGGAAAAALSPSGPRSMAVSGGALMTRSTPRLLTHALMSTSTLSIAALCCTKKACSFFFLDKRGEEKGEGEGLEDGRYRRDRKSERWGTHQQRGPRGGCGAVLGPPRLVLLQAVGRRGSGGENRGIKVGGGERDSAPLPCRARCK